MARQASVAIDVEIRSFRLGPNARVPAVEVPGSGGGGGGRGSRGGGGGGGGRRRDETPEEEEARWQRQEDARERRRQWRERNGYGFPGGRPPGTPPRGLFGQGGAFDIAGNIAGAGGALGARRQLISFGYLGAELASITPQLAAITVVLIGIIAAVAAFIAALKVAINIVKIFARVMLSQLKICLDAVLALGRGFFWLMREALLGTVRVVQWFGQKSVEALEWAANAFRRLAAEGTRAFTELQLEAAKVATVMGGIGEASNQARETVMQFALEMSSRTQFAAKEVAEAMYEAYSAGFVGQKAVEALTEASLYLAAATQSQTEPVMAMLAATLNTYKIAVEQSAAVSDVFTAAIFYSAATMPKLIESMKYAGPVSAAFGVNLKETVAILEGFYQAGLQGSMAGTYFRQAMVALTNQTRRAQNAFKALGVEFNDLSVVKSGSLMKSLEMLEDIQRRVGKKELTNAIVQAFGSRGSFGLITLLNVGTMQLKKYQGQLNATGLTAKAAADQLRTLSGAWKLLTNLWTNFETKLIKGTVATSFVWFIGVLQDLVKWAEASGALAAMQNVLAAVVYTLGGLAQQVGPTLVTVLRDIMVQIPAVVYELGAGLLAVLPDVLLFLRWLPGLFKDAFANVIPVLVRFAGTFIPLFLQIAKIVLPLLVDVLTKVGGALVQFLQDNQSNILTWFTTFADLVGQVLNVLPQVVPLVGQLLTLFVQWAPVLLQTAVNALPELLKVVKQLIPWLAYMASNIFPMLVAGIQAFVGFIGGPGLAIFRAFANNVVSFMQWLKENWPLVIWIVTNGLYAWAQLLSLAGSNMRDLLDVVTNLLGYLKANWAPAWKVASEVVAKALEFLADVIDIAPMIVSVLDPIAVTFMLILETASLTISVIGSLFDLVKTGGANFKQIWKLFADMQAMWPTYFKLSRGAADMGEATAPRFRDAARRVRDFGARAGRTPGANGERIAMNGQASTVNIGWQQQMDGRTIDERVAQVIIRDGRIAEVRGAGGLGLSWNSGTA